MKNQVLFSSKDKSRKLKCCLLQFLFGALRVNITLFSETRLGGLFELELLIGLIQFW